MDRLKICRICLAEDIRMVPLVKTHLQTMYETITMMPLETGDRRPLQACYICCARLQNCYQLRMTCLQSEYLFTQMLSRNTLLPLKAESLNNKNRLKIEHPVILLSMGNKLQQDSSRNFRMMDPEICIVVKKECEDIEDENMKQNVELHHNTSGLASEYYMPINIIKMEKDGAEITMTDEAVEESAGDQYSQPLHLEERLSIEIIKEDNHETSDPVPDYTCPTMADRVRSEHKNINEQPETASETQTVSDPSCIKNKPIHKRAQHINIHKNIRVRKRHQCNICKKTFLQKGHLITHFRIHTGEKPYQCDDCKKCFSRKGNLTIHIRKHTGEKPYQCKFCKQCFNIRSSLNVHTREHTGKTPYQCDLCNKYFNRRSDLNIHIRGHTGEKPFGCEVCTKRFKRKGELTAHLRVHTVEKPFQCNVCLKCYKLKGQLNTHIRKHTGEKPYTCDVCNKCFSQKIRLSQHSLIHTDIKPYKCDVCKKCFSYKNRLNQHIRLHTGEKPYQCDVCMKRFIRKGDLTIHARIHSVAKPFQCSVCMKCFKQRSHLTSHVRTHTGDRPYQCDLCKKYFSRKTNLGKHIKFNCKTFE